MTRILSRMRIFLACSLLAVLAAGKDGGNTVASMGWLAGNWQGPMGDGTFAAHYSTPDGGKILSFSELRKGDRVAFYEFETFETKDGTVLLTPYPGGGKRASFTLTSVEEKKAVFENPKKDFPTRIVYHRAADDRLLITLSDPHGGSDKVQTFDLAAKR